MSGRSAAADRWKKAVAMTLSLFGRGFNPSKCKTSAKMAVARIKLLRNKREVVIRQIRRDIAMLLESGQDATARIRVEHVIREQNIMAANELIELFCDLVVARLSIIAKQRECPPDLKEGISSLIFAGPRCSELPELQAIRDVFQKKYGKDFVSTATDLRPNAGVNRLLIEKLSVKTPSGELKLKVLKEIAKEYQVQWDTTETEEELLKPPEERLDGPNGFVSASGLPLKPVQKQSLEPNDASNRGQGNMMSFQDVASAAGVAAEKALAAAEAAAVLAAYGGKQTPASFKGTSDFNNSSHNSSRKFMPNSGSEYSTIDQTEDHRTIKTNGGEYSYYNEENEQRVNDGRKVVRRQSSNSSRNSNGKSMPSNRAEYSTVDQPGDEYSHYNEENEQRVNDGRKVVRRQRSNSSRNSNGKSMPSNRAEYSTVDQPGDEYSHFDEENEQRVIRRQSYDSYCNSSGKTMPNYRAEYSTVDQFEDHRTMKANGDEETEQRVNDGRKVIRRQSYNCQRAPTDIKFDESDCDEEIEMEAPASAKTVNCSNRRYSYNVPPPHSDARYDEYDDDEEEEEEDVPDDFRQPPRSTTNQAPERPPPQIPARRVHPNLPDYDILTARFEALKQHKMRPR